MHALHHSLARGVDVRLIPAIQYAKMHEVSQMAGGSEAFSPVANYLLRVVRTDLVLDPNLLLVRALLIVMIKVPAQGGKEFAYPVFSRAYFRVHRGQVIGFLCLEILD